MAIQQQVQTNEPSSKGSRTNLDKSNPNSIEIYLKGLSYPANKIDLIHCATKNNSPQDVIKVLEKFGEHQYQSMDEIAQEFSHTK